MRGSVSQMTKIILIIRGEKVRKIIITPSLNEYMDKSVSELIKGKNNIISEGQKERHQLYSLLLMSIIHYYWNGSKEGKGEYPLNPKEENSNESPFMQNDYIGHNIAALAVDNFGSIIDFDFNHNKIFASSDQHAEMRLVKRIYSLSQINDSWETGKNSDRDYMKFSDVSIYTSLESCAQCSGVMTLANLKEVIYLQSDPGQYFIGNILRNLTKKDERPAPVPVSGQEFQFKYFNYLNDAYYDFYFREPIFYIDKNGKCKKTNSLTSFLCIEEAYKIYTEAKNEFMQLINLCQELKYPNYKPDINQYMKTNLDVLYEVGDFYEYATKNGRRGTAH